MGDITEHAIDPGDLRRAVEAMMRSQWHDTGAAGTVAGYTAPNLERYPWQWLWDSCFHSIVWLALGEADRALAELASVFTWQTPAGFVPHMSYQLDPAFGAEYWKIPNHSTITQPPMYGHAIACLIRAGVEVPAALIERAERGLQWLLGERVRPDGLVAIVHPWESGCDDSPRWDSFRDPAVDWRQRKTDLLRHGGFDVGSVMFSALVAFNARELASVLSSDLVVDGVLDALDSAWNGHTWCDSRSASGHADTLEGLLPMLVDRSAARSRLALDRVTDPAQFGGATGPAGVNRSHPAYEPSVYWRGAAWPQQTYLCWVAAQRSNSLDHAAQLAAMLINGACRSGLAEYWHPDTGEGFGARPQGWAGLAVAVESLPWSVFIP